MKTKIIYEDEDILVCYKPAGIATQTGKVSSPDVVSELKNYLTANSEIKEEPYLGIIHRLDQPVEGILVFAKNQKAAASLSAQATDKRMEKYYHARVYGVPDILESTLTDYLLKNNKENTSKVVPMGTKEAKRSELVYKVLFETNNQESLLEIKLLTGRHHQIRVQLSHAGHPLIGDLKYGTEESISYSEKQGIKTVVLCAFRLVFVHPKTNKQVIFEI